MRQEEATKAVNLFEGAYEQNRVSKRSLKNWVVMTFSALVYLPNGVIISPEDDYPNITMVSWVGECI